MMCDDVVTFYRMFPAAGSGFGVAQADEKVACGGPLYDRGLVTGWVPVEFTIREGEWQGRLGDFANNDLGWRLCSARMKDVVESLRSDADKVQWLSSFVTDLAGHRIQYFVLHFPEIPDILDLDPGETVYDEEILIRPCISLKKAEMHRIFTIRGLEVATVVHDRVRQVLEEAGMQGMEFHSIRQR